MKEKQKKVTRHIQEMIRIQVKCDLKTNEREKNVVKQNN